MALPAGKRLGAYEILGMIGVGGMGEVYKARDTRLQRIVAIKVLPDHVANDPDFRQRFEREAKAISSLSHPHICTLYDVGSEGGVEFLVMEHLEGETITQRLAKGPIPFPQVLRYAVEIAEALERAHRQGITHRDLKPGNIMLTKGGAKLLDFGLAKLKPVTAIRASNSVATQPPELLTASGAILGTLQYMAPEQVEGKPVDHRADVFAYGAIVYEMATGKRAFDGDSQASLIGAILKDEPRPISALQPLSPPAFDMLIATCLAKEPDERWQSAGDLGRHLQLMQGSSSQLSLPPGALVAASSARAGWRRGLLFALGTLGVGAVLAGSAVWSWTRPAPAEPPRVSRFLIMPPSSAPLASLGGWDVIVSPDGERIAYFAVSGRGGGVVLYVRELAELEARILPETEITQPDIGGLNPVFSADGRSIAFLSPGRGIVRVALGGGPPLTILDDWPGSPTFLGAAWTADDTLIYGTIGGLYRARASGGGTPERLTPEGSGNLYTSPVLLPGGRAVLFGLVMGTTAQVALLDLDTHEQHVLVDDGDNPWYLAPGHLVFARGTTLMAAPFDADRRVLTGEPVAVLPGVRRPNVNSATDFAVSGNGTLVYVPGGREGGTRELVWVNRNGVAAGRAVNDLVEMPADPRLSPDGRRLVLTTPWFGSSRGLWIYDLAGRPPVPLIDEGNNGTPVWSPDGTTVAFTSNRSGEFDVYTLPADGSVRDPQALRPGELIDAGPVAWSPGGELVLELVRAAGDRDILAVDAGGQGDVRNVVASADSETYPALSADGRWLAYVSNRTGRPEVWVRRYPDGVPLRISQNGGVEPVWSRDGNELFYRQGNAMMAVAVDTSGTQLAFEAAVELFAEPYFASPSSTIRSYDVAPDGRFLMIRTAGEDGREPSGIVVVQNWTEELKRLAPAR